MSEKLNWCPGSHGGAQKWCDTCAHNIENYDDDPNRPEREWISDLPCRLPAGPERKYWTQYVPIHLDG